MANPNFNGINNEDILNSVNETGSTVARLNSKVNELQQTIGDVDSSLKKLKTDLPKTVADLTKTLNKNMLFSFKDVNNSYIKGVVDSVRSQTKSDLDAISNNYGEIAKKLGAVMESEYSDATTVNMARNAKARAEEQKAYFDSLSYQKQINYKFALETKNLLIDTGKKIFSDLFDYAKKLIEQTYQADKATIESNYSDTMALNSYSKGEYAKIIDRLQDLIDDAGLSKSININDMQNNLVSTLKAGLQGQVAEMNAFYATIAQSSGITFNWDDSDWVKMIAQMAATGKDYEAVMKNIISTTDDLAEYYGYSTGLANNQSNQMMTYASQLGQTYGLDDKAITDIYKSYAITSQELANYHVNSSAVFDAMTTALEKGLTDDSMLTLFATGSMTADDVRAKMESGDFNELIKNYISNATNMVSNSDSGEMRSVLAGAMGGSFNYNDYVGLETYMKDNGEFAKNFDKAYAENNSTIESIEEEISNYVLPEEEFRNQIAKDVAGIAEWFTQHPILSQVGQSAMNGASIFAGLAGRTLLDKALGGSSSGTSILGKLGGKLGSLGSATGASADAVGGTSMFGGIRSIDKVLGSTAGKALGGVGAAIGIGVDAYKGYQSNGELGALEGGLTGVTDRDAIWQGEGILKAIGSNAAKGAAVGTMFSPVGTAIGALAGALVSGATILAEYNSEAGKAARAITHSQEALSNLAKTADEVKTAQSKLSENTDILTKAQDGNKDALEIVKEKYPLYATELDRLTADSVEYQDILKKLRKEEERKYNQSINANFSNAMSSSKSKASDATANFNSASKAFENKSNIKAINEAVGKAETTATGKWTGTDSMGNFRYKDKSGKEHTLYASDYATLLNSYGINTDGMKSGEIFAIAEKIGLIDIGFDTSDIDKKYDMSNYNGAIESIQTAYNNIKGINLASMYTAFATKDDLFGNSGMTKLGWENLFSNYWFLGKVQEKYPDEFKVALGGWDTYLNTFGETEDEDGNKVRVTPQVFWNHFGGEDTFGNKYTPTYAVGTRYVPKDNYLALLHRGEQVRTAAEVAVEKAESHVASSDAISTLDSTLLTQTNTIIGLLTNIYDLVQRLPNMISTKRNGTGVNSRTFDLPTL